jgi:hypothetical protein
MCYFINRFTARYRATLTIVVPRKAISGRCLMPTPAKSFQNLLPGHNRCRVVSSLIASIALPTLLDTANVGVRHGLTSDDARADDRLIDTDKQLTRLHPTFCGARFTAVQLS